MKILIFTLVSSIYLAQINPPRNKGEVFKHSPEKPYENLENSGLVIVTKTIYGLIFEDYHLSFEVKNRINKFFNLRLNGYTELRKYKLSIHKKKDNWFIENVKI